MTRCLRFSTLRFVLAIAAAWLGSGLLQPDVARAHRDLDEAKRLASDLEFDAALNAFERALKSDELTRQELVQLLSERALVLHALHRKDELVKDFEWLSALAPDHRLDLRAPPDLTALWTSVRDQGRGPLQVKLEAEAGDAGALSARATLTGTVPEGARPRLWLRRPGGNFGVVPLPELRESAPDGTTLELYAQAVGLGNVVLAEDHDASEPLRITARGGSADGTGPVDGAAQPSWAKRHKGWLIGGAVVLAVAAGVVTGVMLARGDGDNDKTNLKPMVSF
jgi:tetratricopeptide (TPR) repeat protein